MSGNGRPVVFLHGFLESITMWEHIQLPENCQSILIDLPGHGESRELYEQEMSILEMAQSVQLVLDELNISTFDAVGHSMGGYVALALKEMDDRCGKLTLLNSNFWEDSDQKKLDRMRVAKIVRKSPKLFIYEVIPNLFMDPEGCDEQVKALIGEAVQIHPEAIAMASIAMSRRTDYSDYLNKWAKDLSVIQGTEDTIVPVERMRAGLIDQMNYLELEDVGHMAHIEASERVSEYLKNCYK